MSITDETNAVIMAGGEGKRLGLSTLYRAKPAIRFGRGIICDSSVNVAKNSEIKRIFILDQYKPYSLEKYYASLYRTGPGQEIEFLNPFHSGGSFYDGTADAVWQNQDFVTRNPNIKYHVVLSGDHVYRADLRKVLEYHAQQKEHKITVFARRVRVEDACRFGVLEVAQEREGEFMITGFEEKPQNPKTIPDQPEHSLISMGIYIFEKDTLWNLLKEDSEKAHYRTSTGQTVKHLDIETEHDFGKDVLPHALRTGVPMYIHMFDGYWTDVGTDKAYFDTVQDVFIRRNPDLFGDPSWTIRTDGTNFFCKGVSPFYTSGSADIQNSSLDNVVMSPGCLVHDSDLVQTIVYGQSEPESLRMSEVKRSKLYGVIVGKDVIMEGAEIIGNPDYMETDGVRHSGLIQIEKGAIIPAGTKINCSTGAFIVKPESCVKSDIAQRILDFRKEVNPTLKVFLSDGTEVSMQEIARYATGH